MGKTTICTFECAKVTATLGMVDGQSAEVYDVELVPVATDETKDKKVFVETPEGALNLKSLRVCPFKVGSLYELEASG